MEQVIASFPLRKVSPDQKYADDNYPWRQLSPINNVVIFIKKNGCAVLGVYSINDHGKNKRKIDPIKMI